MNTSTKRKPLPNIKGDTMNNAIVDTLRDMGLTMACERRNSRANTDDWGKGASHWNIVIANSNSCQHFDLVYSMGSAHTGSPKLDDVMYCCLTDAMCYGNSESFDDFCSDLGYETDEPEQRQKAVRVYRACAKMHKDLNAMFSKEELEELADIFEDF